MRPTEPPAAVSGDDADHQHRTDDAAPRKLVGRWAPDPDLGHELGGAFVLSPRHALAGVNIDAVTDSGAVGVDGGRGTVLAHALGCLIAMAHRCVSLGAF